MLNTFAKENTFRASRDGPIQAVVMEVTQQASTGKTASVLVTSGTLGRRQNLVATNGAFCTVRQLYDSNGDVVDAAYPSDPVQVIGWKSLPQPGSYFLVNG